MDMSANAGCSAHVSKPVSKAELLGVIEKYGPPLNSVEIEHAGASGPIAIEMPPGLEGIVPGYLASRRKEVPEMIDLLAASDFARLAVLGHNLKGSGGGYGFQDLTKLGAALEQSAKQMDTAGLRTQVADLGNYLDRVQLFAAV
jgi:HPt (histidine-containing phosphotransfer) domain-containing protein